MDISGKTVIVTGAASGIGLGTATALAEAGANVVVADIQKEAVEEVAHGLSGTSKRVMPVRIDVTSNPCSMHWRRPNAIPVSSTSRTTRRRRPVQVLDPVGDGRLQILDCVLEFD
jgi:NAD(P)-dependent dehydrogenase (short-subunit alcohol dehydrogenase family)